MPSEKRQRQRENSRARQEAAAAAAARSKNRSRLIFGVVVAVALIGAVAFAMSGGDDKKDNVAATTTTTTAKAAKAPSCPPAEGAATRTVTFKAAPKMCIDEDKSYTALIKTDAGDVTVALDAKAAPTTVNNFVFLARNKFYEGVSFHRVIKNFMVQGGDPEGTGSGGPGYSIPDEFSKDHKFQVGDIAMAKTVQPDSGGSQFFVVTGPQGESLPPEYSYFGKVTSGLDVIRAIEADGSDADPAPPAVLHKIISVTITEE